jgi:hypothetical protein
VPRAHRAVRHAGALKLTLNASFEKMIRAGTRIQNYLDNKADLRARQRCASWWEQKGDIYAPAISIRCARSTTNWLTPGVDAPGEIAVDAGVRWTEVTEGSAAARYARQLRRLPKSIEQLRGNSALGHRRQPGRQRLSLEHARGAAARP